MCDNILISNPKLQHVLSYLTCLISGYIIPLIFAIAIIGFLWGVVNFVILGQEDERKRTQGRQLMVWGIIAITVMIAVWGLVKIITNTFNLPGGVLPSVNPTSGGTSGGTSGAGCTPGTICYN
jgi:hypothetical protein